MLAGKDGFDSTPPAAAMNAPWAGSAEGERRGKAEGIAEGERRGKVEGKAEAVLAVLTARGIAVDEAMRARILGCQDEKLLLRWLQWEATARTAVEVLGV